STPPWSRRRFFHLRQESPGLHCRTDEPKKSWTLSTRSPTADRPLPVVLLVRHPECHQSPLAAKFLPTPGDGASVDKVEAPRSVSHLGIFRTASSSTLLVVNRSSQRLGDSLYVRTAEDSAVAEAQVRFGQFPGHE